MACWCGWRKPHAVSLLALLCRTLTAGRTSGPSTVSSSVMMKCSSWIWTATGQEKPMTLMSGPGRQSGHIWRPSLGLFSSWGTLRTPSPPYWWNPTATGRLRTTPRSICSMSGSPLSRRWHRERIRQGEKHLSDPPDAEGPLERRQDDHHRRLHPLQHHDQDAGGGAGGGRWGLGLSWGGHWADGRTREGGCQVGFSISIPKFISWKSNLDGGTNHCFAGILPVLQNRNWVILGVYRNKYRVRV